MRFPTHRRRCSRRFAPSADGNPRVCALEARALAAPGLVRAFSPYLLDPDTLAVASQASSQGWSSPIVSELVSTISPVSPPSSFTSTAPVSMRFALGPGPAESGPIPLFYTDAGATPIEASVTDGYGTILGDQIASNWVDESGLAVTVVQNPPFAPSLTLTNTATICNASVGDLPFPGSSSTISLHAGFQEDQSVTGLNMTGATAPGLGVRIWEYGGLANGPARGYLLAVDGPTGVTATLEEHLNATYTPPAVATMMTPTVTDVDMTGSAVAFGSPNLAVGWIPGALPTVTIAAGAQVISNVQTNDAINIDFRTTVVVPAFPAGVPFPVGYGVNLHSAIVGANNTASSGSSNEELLTFNYTATLTGN